MSNTQAMCSSFKSEILSGVHALGTTVVRGGTGADSIKAALYVQSGSQGPSTTSYSATNEVVGSGYTAGGVAVSNANAPSTSGTSGIWTPSASFVWNTVTLSTPFDCVTLYNASQGNRAISVHTFSAQTVTAGNFTLQMPVNAVGTALLQIS